MADAALTSLVQYLRRTVAGPQEQTDGQLLERFLRHREEAAFTTLLQRHGPMVLGVCRRLLGHDAAEDAFQATWLVLLHRARSIRKRESLGSWLYGVAYRTALKARAEAARRGLLERPLLEVPAAPSVSNLGAAELRAELDAEVRRLARHYRAPVVLCYFQNKTYTEAAQILGIAAGTKPRVFRLSGKELRRLPGKEKRAKLAEWRYPEGLKGAKSGLSPLFGRREG
jgi:RNA polymerase sigma factor (sigma-70 family)